MNCTFSGCASPLKARGLCSGHYQQMRKGKELTPLGEALRQAKASPSRDEAFWMRVDKGPDCWQWTGSTTTRGYGVFKYKSERTYAHRHSLELALGESLGERMVDHLCHNSLCVNPRHLRPASNSENQQNLRGAKSSSKSGVLGVSWEPPRGGRVGGWVAEVKADGVRYRKRFDSIESADRWAQETRARYHHVPKV